MRRDWQLLPPTGRMTEQQSQSPINQVSLQPAEGKGSSGPQPVLARTLAGNMPPLTHAFMLIEGLQPTLYLCKKPRFQFVTAATRHP